MQTASNGAKEFARRIGPTFHDGMYMEAKSWRDPETGANCQPVSWLAAQLRAKGVGPEDQELSKRQAHYLREFRVPEWALDRTAEVKAFAEDSWYLERIMQAANVPMRGRLAPEAGDAFTRSGPRIDPAFLPGEGMGQKAFGVSTLLTVFPFFWDTQIQEGILAVPLLDILVMDTTTVNSGTAVHPLLNETVADRSPGETTEFGTFQEIFVSVTEDPIKLRKFGSLINLSDEAMRRMRVPVFSRFIARHGRQIGIDMTSFAIDVTINGDVAQGGTLGATPTISPTVPAIAGSPTYADWVGMLTDFKIGYEPTDFIFTKAGLRKLLVIPQFEDPLAGFKFQNQGVLPEVMGLMPHRWDDNKSSTWNPDTVNQGTGTGVLMVQRNRSLQMYQDGGLSTESDRIINGEYTQLKTSWILGFAVWDRESARFSTGWA
jgi:hypothetical protein